MRLLCMMAAQARSVSLFALGAALAYLGTLLGMTEKIHINLPSPDITTAWKTNWNYFAGRAIEPDLRFESLICLSLAPDFVLDFGWHLRDEQIWFDLQINRGHFGLSDVVVYESTQSLDTAYAQLQSWINRLSANESERANDADLQKRLLEIETKLRCYFVPPLGEPIDEILPRTIRKLILVGPSSWWQMGSSDAALQYRYRTGVVHSQLIFLQRDPYGFHIEYHAPKDPVMYCRSRRTKAKQNKHVTITLGGAPWDLPLDSFVSPSMAAKITAAFILEGTGNLPIVGQWEQP